MERGSTGKGKCEECRQMHMQGRALNTRCSVAAPPAACAVVFMEWCGISPMDDVLRPCSTCVSTLQFQWDRLLAQLRSVAASVSVCADRGALLATQNIAPAVRGVFRAAAGLPLHEGVHLGSGEELVLQVRWVIGNWRGQKQRGKLWGLKAAS